MKKCFHERCQNKRGDGSCHFAFHNSCTRFIPEPEQKATYPVESLSAGSPSFDYGDLVEHETHGLGSIEEIYLKSASAWIKCEDGKLYLCGLSELKKANTPHQTEETTGENDE